MLLFILVGQLGFHALFDDLDVLDLGRALRRHQRVLRVQTRRVRLLHRVLLAHGQVGHGVFAVLKVGIGHRQRVLRFIRLTIRVDPLAGDRNAQRCLRFLSDVVAFPGLLHRQRRMLLFILVGDSCGVFVVSRDDLGSIAVFDIAILAPAVRGIASRLGDHIGGAYRNLVQLDSPGSRNSDGNGHLIAAGDSSPHSTAGHFNLGSVDGRSSIGQRHVKGEALARRKVTGVRNRLGDGQGTVLRRFFLLVGHRDGAGLDAIVIGEGLEFIALRYAVLVLRDEILVVVAVGVLLVQLVPGIVPAVSQGQSLGLGEGCVYLRIAVSSSRSGLHLHAAKGSPSLIITGYIEFDLHAIPCSRNRFAARVCSFTNNVIGTGAITVSDLAIVETRPTHSQGTALFYHQFLLIRIAGRAIIIDLNRDLRAQQLRGLALQGNGSGQVFGLFVRQLIAVVVDPHLFHHDAGVRGVDHVFGLAAIEQIDRIVLRGTFRRSSHAVAKVEIVPRRRIGEAVARRGLGLHDVIKRILLIQALTGTLAGDHEFAVLARRVLRFLNVSGVVDGEHSALQRLLVHTSFDLIEVVSACAVLIDEYDVRALAIDDLGLFHRSFIGLRFGGSVGSDSIGGLRHDIARQAQRRSVRVLLDHLVIAGDKVRVRIGGNGILIIPQVGVVDLLPEAAGYFIAILVHLDDGELDLLLLFVGQGHVALKALVQRQLLLLRRISHLQNITHIVDPNAILAGIVSGVGVIGDDKAVQRGIQLIARRRLDLLKVINGILLQCHTMRIAAE